MRKIKPFKQYDHLFEEAKLELEVDLERILKSFTKDDRSNYSIAQAILKLTTEDNTLNDVQKLAFSDETKKLLVSIGKQENSQNIGRIIRHILTNINIPFADIEIERFFNSLHGKIIAAKANGSQLPNGRLIQIVTGDDIAKYYDTRNTVQVGGTTELQRSCMNMFGKRGMISIYTKNKAVNLVIITIGGKVVARALLWQLWRASNDAKWLLDRVYSHDKADEDTVWDWLQQQDKYAGKTLRKKGTEILNQEAIVKLEKVIHFSYPFLDTLSALYIKESGNKLLDEGFISNVSRHNSFDQNTSICKWISEQKDYIEFKLKDLKGAKAAVDLRGLDYLNIPKFLIVSGVPEIKDHEGEFKQELGLIDAITKRASSGEELVKWEWSYDIPLNAVAVANDPNNYKIQSTLEASFVSTWYIKKADLVETIEGHKIPKDIAIPVVDVTSFLRSRSYMSIISKARYDAYWQSIFFKDNNKLMSIIDAKILGIWNSVKQSEVYYTKLKDLRRLNNFGYLRKFAKDKKSLEIRKNLTDKIEEIKDNSPFG
jgi:hypothetical protein